jgi:hypothetical protein
MSRTRLHVFVEHNPCVDELRMLIVEDAGNAQIMHSSARTSGWCFRLNVASSLDQNASHASGSSTFIEIHALRSVADGDG